MLNAWCSWELDEKTDTTFKSVQWRCSSLLSRLSIKTGGRCCLATSKRTFAYQHL